MPAGGDPNRVRDVQVLIVSWEYPPIVEGGLARHVRKLSERLVRDGHDVHVLTRSGGGPPGPGGRPPRGGGGPPRRGRPPRSRAGLPQGRPRRLHRLGGANETPTWRPRGPS